MVVVGLEETLNIYQDEAELLRGLRQGEPDSCTCLMQRFAPMVYGQALRVVKDPHEAENVLQLTFLKACEKIQSFEGRSGMSTWLYRIARNEALMRLRRQTITHVPIDHVHESVLDDHPQISIHHWSRDPSAAILNTELQQQVERALAVLPETLRLVFVLREIEGLSTEETAQILSISISAVKVRLHRARLRLRELLASYMEVARK